MTPNRRLSLNIQTARWRCDGSYFYGAGIFIFQTRSHTYNTRNRNDILAPFHRLSTTQHSVSFHGAHLWNTLPQEIREAPTLKSFKFKLKLFFLENYKE